jgi:hypothetical protein
VSIAKCVETHFKGRAIAQAISRCFPTAAARVRVPVWSCGIYGGQSDTGAGFFENFGSPANLHSTHCSKITIIYHLGLVQQANSGCSTKWTQSHPNNNNNNNNNNNDNNNNNNNNNNNPFEFKISQHTD